MKKQKKKTIFIILFLIIIGIFFFLNKSKIKGDFQDDLIFFKIFSSNLSNISKSNQDSTPVYYFLESNQNFDSKEVTLVDTIRKDTLIQEKIAPRNGRRF